MRGAGARNAETPPRNAAGSVASAPRPSGGMELSRGREVAAQLPPPAVLSCGEAGGGGAAAASPWNRPVPSAAAATITSSSAGPSTSEVRRDVQQITKSLRSTTISPQQNVLKSDGRGVVGASKKVVAAMKTTERPLRNKEVGTNKDCESIDVWANHFAVTLKNLPEDLYHYDVAISPLDRAEKAYEATLPDKILPHVWREFARSCPYVSDISTPFDGKKNVYTSRRIDFDGNNTHTQIVSMEDLDDPGRTRSFKVTVKLVSTVRTQSLIDFMKSGGSGTHREYPQDVIQALDVALRYNPSLQYTVVNRSFFSPPAPNMRRYILNEQLELWSGHYQSLTVGCDNNASLNIDLATKAFYQAMPMMKYLRLILGMGESDSFDVRHWQQADIIKASEALKGKLIAYGTGPKTNGKFATEHAFPAVGIVMETAAGYRFKSQDQEISIIEHFASKNTTIEHGNFPCVHIGSVKQTNYVPLELCRIIPQAYRGKMDKTLTAAMIKGAAVGPKERFERILHSREGCRFDDCPAVRDFGMRVDRQLTKITGAKKFAVPGIRTGKAAGGFPTVDKTTGGWNYRGRNDRQSHQFLKPAEVPKFAVLTFEEVDVRRFIDKLEELGIEMGMRNFKEARKTVETSNLKIRNGDRYMSEKIRKQLQKWKTENVKLVFVVLGTDGKEYATVKAEAEVQVGILTACVKKKNVLSCQHQTMTNFLLKLNSKLNGVNWNIDSINQNLNGEPTIIFGADVTHPAPNSKAPSIAAVTASYDLSGMCFNMHIQPQLARQELITGIGGIVTNMVKDFQKKSGTLPKSLIMFRDGVSEGYFDEIKAKEYEQIKSACELFPGSPMKITFVVVKKRHHTRLQPVNQRSGVGKFLNIPPGTVIDKVLVHPTEQEFFLNSHVGIQGTSKPTRYHVIHDDNKFTMSQMERLTYHLCYAFVRCTQPVSYPAATYYAHLAAYRARLLIEKEGENADIAQLQRQLTIHPDLIKNYPFFYIYKKDPPKVAGVYSQPGKWYWIKVAFFYSLVSIRKWKDQKDNAKRDRDHTKLEGYNDGFGTKSKSEMDRIQPLSDHFQAIDAIYFNGANFKGFSIITGTARRAHGVINGFLIVRIPELGYLVSPKFPETTLFGGSDECYGAEGFRYEPVETMKHWKLEYKGEMKYHDNPGRKVKVHLKADWKSKLDYFDFDSMVPSWTLARAISLEKWSREYFNLLKEAHQTHYEQNGDLIGEIEVDGKTFRFETPSMRDHSYGVKRDWKLLHRYIFHFFALEDGRRFNIGNVCQPITSSSLEFGYMYDHDGSLHALELVDLPLYYHGEGGNPPTDYGMKVKDTNGHTYFVQVKVLETQELYIGWEWEARIVERRCKFTVNGIEGGLRNF